MILHFRARHFSSRHLQALSSGIAVTEVACLANDVISTSSVTKPAAGIQRGILANDVKSNSSVTQPAAHQVHGLDASNVVSATFLTKPVVGGPGQIFADDVTSLSTVGKPALHQTGGLLAENVISASSVTTPALVVIAPSVEQALLANDVVSASFVSTPALVEGTWPVEPEVPVGGGGGPGYGYYDDEYYRQRDQEQEERERERKRSLRKLAEAIDRAIARAQGQLEPPEDAETPLPVAEVVAIDDALEGIQDRVHQIEALGARILQADAELEALRLEAIELIRQAELDDDDEALELLLAA